MADSVSVHQLIATMAVRDGLHRNWCPKHHRAVARRHKFHQQQLIERLHIKVMADSMSVRQLIATMAEHHRAVVQTTNSIDGSSLRDCA